MAEPREKRARREFENVQLEPFPEAANDRLISAVRDLNPEAISQALSEGAHPDLTIDNEPLVRYMKRTFIDRHRARAAQVSQEEFKQLLDSIALFPKHERELGEDWEFYFLRDFRFPENLFRLFRKSITPAWIDLILASDQGLVPQLYIDEIVGLTLKEYHQHSPFLTYIDKGRKLGPENVVKFLNYPLYALDFVHRTLGIPLLERFETIPKNVKLSLCSVEPLRGGYSSLEEAFKDLLNQFSREGFFVLKTVPIRFWWDLVNIYLYGVRAMAKTDFQPLIPYVIETGVIPLSGHLDRVKFLPGFRKDLIDQKLIWINDTLRELADKCQTDQDVRDYLIQTYRIV